MRKEKLTKFCALSLGLILVWSLPGCFFNPVTSLEVENKVTNSEIIAQLTKADVVYLGENHDSLKEHQAQLAIITALYQQNQQIAIALEMFQRPFQNILERYLKGEINEAQLREQTEYDRRWGFNWEYYAPILRFAKAHNLQLLALNTPTEITQKVARNGLESLTGDDFRYIPPLREIKLDNRDYRQMLEAVYNAHADGGHGNSKGFDNFFATQVLWDETMAEAIAQFYQANPNYQIVVLTGQGHVIYNYGIPQRVQRRLQKSSLVQRSVLLGEIQGFSDERSPADFIWQYQ
jgi:uncharacterized iron-regulated protein